jgi:hypothetical protein
MQQIQLTFDVHQLRRRLQKMTDNELREFGRAAAVTSPLCLEGSATLGTSIGRVAGCVLKTTTELTLLASVPVGAFLASGKDGSPQDSGPGVFRAGTEGDYFFRRVLDLTKFPELGMPKFSETATRLLKFEDCFF